MDDVWNTSRAKLNAGIVKVGGSYAIIHPIMEFTLSGLWNATTAKVKAFDYQNNKLSGAQIKMKVKLKISCAVFGGVSPKNGKRVGSRHRWKDGNVCEFCGRTVSEVTKTIERKLK